MRYRARYKDAAGKESPAHSPTRRIEAQRWLDEVTTSQVTGTYVDPKTARTTVEEWCSTWLAGYATRRARTVRQARVHVAQITAAFGPMPLSAVRPSSVRSWTVELKAAGLADSYVYALHSRLSQVMSDAVHDGLLARNPCSRRTSPGAGGQRPYVATTEQVWALYDAVAEHLRPAILLGAFVGLRTAEVVGLRVWRRRLHARRRAAGAAARRRAAEERDIPHAAARSRRSCRCELSAAVARWGGDHVVTDGAGRQTSTWAIERAIRSARPKVARAARGLPLPRPAALPGVAAHRQRRSTSRSSSTGSGTAAPRRRWTPTATCGRTATSPHGPPWVRCWRLVRTRCGLARPRPAVKPQVRRRCRAQMS